MSIRINAGALPMLPGAKEYAFRGIVTGGGERNRQHLDGRLDVSGEVSPEVESLLYDPQTSGGLLFALPPEAARDADRRFAEAGEPLLVHRRGGRGRGDRR